ncbi:ATP-binding protein [Sphingomonas sp. 7/4-4]|uniref:AlbA family DNA-binding domain-containing protein n=1 Tax=Sphingomonas sp. 7/4-4 TaxID=3018446 RepID=UPI0022F3B9C5|nr:ATP-binding protein [Sphingomonas sp. 7/4-4]WBY06709.1 ATP-binding protein [Sphingomonas sp. 7/4-4]
MGLSEAQFNEAALLQLCVDRAPESLTLEFKRSLPGRSDRDRAEFLKDVSALANAAGGQLVYGVEEKDGTAAALIPTSDEVIDDIVRRLSQVLDAGIEPRLANVSFHPVSLEGVTH